MALHSIYDGTPLGSLCRLLSLFVNKTPFFTSPREDAKRPLTTRRWVLSLFTSSNLYVSPRFDPLRLCSAYSESSLCHSNVITGCQFHLRLLSIQVVAIVTTASSTMTGILCVQVTHRMASAAEWLPANFPSHPNIFYRLLYSINFFFSLKSYDSKVREIIKLIVIRTLQLSVGTGKKVDHQRHYSLSYNEPVYCESFQIQSGRALEKGGGVGGDSETFTCFVKSWRPKIKSWNDTMPLEIPSLSISISSRWIGVAKAIMP